MTTRRKGIDVEAWVRTLAVPVITILLVAVGFYWQQKGTTENLKLALDKHDAQFKEVAATFEKFNQTQQKNYSDWAATNQAMAEKTEKNAKEERDIRDKMREQFMQTFAQFGQSAAAMKVQVETIGKQLDGITTKVDSIRTIQQQDRVTVPTKR